MIAIIDYGVGNLFSVEKALAALGAEARIISQPSEILRASKIVLPGVGAFGDCIRNLQESGLVPTILKAVSEGVPLLGICVGLQILFEGSDESPGVAGLGLLSGRVRKIQAPGLKIPHMGWNSLAVRQPRQGVDLFKGLSEKPFVYFVHSYHAMPKDEKVITATCEYGEQITAAVAKENIQATQFHPEKSGDVGLCILKNFVTG